MIKSHFRTVSSALIIVLIVTLCLPASAATMRLVTGNNLEPYTDILLPKGGLITEIVAAVYAEIGLDTDIRFGDWKSGYEDTLGGRFEATFPYQPDQVLSDDYFLSKAIVGVRQSIFVSSKGNGRYWTLSDLADKSFCIAADYRSNREIDALRTMPKSQFKSASTLADCFRMLDSGRVDFVPSYDLLARYTVSRHVQSANGFSALKEPLSIGSLHLLIPKAQPNAVAHRQNFDQAMIVLEAKGELRAIITRHLETLNSTGF